MKTFLLNTASRSNRLGCAFDSPLERTVKNCPADKKAELLEAVRAELAAVNAKLASLSEEMQVHGYRRGTRSGVAWGSRFNRAAHKQTQLEQAIKDLTRPTAQ